MKEKDITPRSYQEELMNIAKQQNTIIYLPTGSGKTYIAVMLIKEKSHELKGTFREGAKRTIFLVNTVALVKQQGDYIQRHTPYNVGQYSGDMNVDFWSKDIWIENIINHEILIMTSQIFINLLVADYIKLTDVNLIIFDECHHAVEDHPMRVIMNKFQDCPRPLQPRVLGLTATIFNGNVKIGDVEKGVRSLETTFLGTVATCDNRELINEYSALPKEKLWPFKNKEYPFSEVEIMMRGIEKLKNLQSFIENFHFEVDDIVIPDERPEKTSLLHKFKGRSNKKLKNLITGVIFHIEDLGIFGGSIACLAHTIQLERLCNSVKDSSTKNVILLMITEVTSVRKMYEDIMKDCDLKSQIRKYSSHKALALFSVLETMIPKSDDKKELMVHDDSDSYLENIFKKKTNFSTLIFVERRFTAKIVYHVLKVLSQCDDNFSFVVPDFMVGFNNNPFNDTREGALEKKRNHQCVNRFRSGISNVLVTSDVLEEGIDVQTCNLVIKYDLTKDYRSYIQSKGRARHKDSTYLIMVEEINYNKFVSKYQGYQKTEQHLLKILVDRTSERQEPTEEEINADLYDDIIPPYDTGVAKVSLKTAIPLINRYCCMLTQDKFTELIPFWYLEETDDKKKRVHLQLPTVSPMREIVKGELMSTKKLAKRAAALEMCKRLHQINELDDTFLPVGRKANEQDYSELFPFFPTDYEKPDDKKIVGSKKRRECYDKVFPEILGNCRPCEGVDLYLHVLKVTPNYPKPDISNHRKYFFHDLLEKDDNYAILSTKPLHKVCEFPIFLNVGELRVQILENASTLRLKETQIKRLETFNIDFFKHLLKIVKQFMVVDRDNLENSYFVVPTCIGDDGNYEINWETVYSLDSLQIVKPSIEERKALEVTEENFHNKVVAPWYRGMLPDQSYIVTKVCWNLTPESPFPSEEYETYEEYFAKKYKLQIYNKNQPLLEVKSISNKINCICPRSFHINNITSKRKRCELQEDFEENLIPELCVRFKYPSIMWLKGTCLPTILHRLTHIMIAEELRITVTKDIGVGCVNLPDDFKWDPLKVDLCCLMDELQWQTHNSPQHLRNLTTGLQKMNVREKSANPLNESSIYDWNGDKEPIDIDRNMENITLVELLNYEDFIHKPLIEGKGRIKFESHPRTTKGSPLKVSCMPPDIEYEPINILANEAEGIGPQQCEILQCLTSASSNDIMNLERHETLGDSFLKLMASLFLFLRYPKIDEGKLTNIKGKIVGNQNLYYCGMERKLGGCVKVQDFSPKSDWIPPNLCVPRKLQWVLKSTQINPSILYDIVMTESDQISGKISNDAWDNIQDKLLASTDQADVHSSMENFISMQRVSDKTIADVVEALVGGYLKASGVRGALKFLGWFRILPPEHSTPERMLDIKPPTACMSNGDIDMHLQNIEILETYLNYTFKDRSYILQALTHASYQCNRVTECYQRLEFLGDAVLDFLITCHIYETCGKLNPGQLTDLRSALVNNITFASLTVKYDIHKFIKYSSPKLMDVMDKFVKFQEDHNHTMNEDIFILLEEGDVPMAEAVEVPKVLGDVFESIAGAIYLDSGLNLETVWRIYHRLMYSTISKFKKNVPKQPVRLLYEFPHSDPRFKPTQKLDDQDVVLVSVSVMIDGRRKNYHGFGQTKQQAKRAAAKLALRALTQQSLIAC